MYAFNKATRVLGMIKRTIRFKDTRVIVLSLYKTLVRPHVEYCISAWSPQGQGAVKRRFKGGSQI